VPSLKPTLRRRRRFWHINDNGHLARPHLFLSFFWMCIPVSSKFSSTSKYLTHTPLSFIVSSAVIQAHHTHTHTIKEITRSSRLYQLSKQFPVDPTPPPPVSSATFLYIWREWPKIAFQVICYSSRTEGSLFHARARSTVLYREDRNVLCIRQTFWR
jgi:hypothetical protein